MPKKIQYALNRKIKESVFLLFDRVQLISYLQETCDLSALFSYLSTIIIKKASWDSITLDRDFIGTAYSHVQKIMSFLLRGGTLYYSPKSIVLMRMGNDSFESNNKMKRFLLDIEGYKKLGDYFFKDDFKLKYYFWNALRKTRSLFYLFKARINANSNDEWQKVEIKLKNVYYSNIQLFIVKYTYKIFSILYYNYKHVKNIRVYKITII